MEIDYSEVAKRLGVRLSDAILECEQWKYIAETLYRSSEELKTQNKDLSDKIDSLQRESEEPSGD